MVNQDLFYLNFNMIYFFKILRPFNLLIISVCILLSALILDKLTIFILPLLGLVLLLAGFANIVNDIIDYKIDQTNRPDRPIASGAISIKIAIIYALLLLLFAFTLILYYPFNPVTIKLIFYINLPLILIYTPFLKRVPLLGNIAVAFILSMVFIITAIYLNGDLNVIMPPATLAFFLMLIREIIKDIADIEGDKQFNINTFPVKFGINQSFILIVCISIILSLLSFYYYYSNLYDLQYLVIVTILIICPLFYHLYHFYKNKTSTYCIYLSKVLKLLTVCGVIVIYLANLFR